METIPVEVLRWLEDERGESLLSSEPIHGGCIHQARILRTQSGSSFFLKSHPSPPGDIFLREAEGLEALRIAEGPSVPEVYLAGDRYLLLEDLKPASRRKDFWVRYGRQLGELHSQESQRFGFPHDNYIGSTPQENGWMEDGIEFFRHRRLVPQIRRAAAGGHLSGQDRRSFECLLEKLPDRIPSVPAVLIHGDLWTGNLITDSLGNPALIDPAAYYGWAEADLAMADLFGRYPDAFYSAYLEVNPLQPGFRERFPIYNLYHLLNHLNLFGRQYLAGVREVLQRFS